MGGSVPTFLKVDFSRPIFSLISIWFCCCFIKWANFWEGLKSCIFPKFSTFLSVSTVAEFATSATSKDGFEFWPRLLLLFTADRLSVQRNSIGHSNSRIFFEPKIP